MSFMANLKGQRALALHGKGRTAEAEKLYEKAYAAGMDQPRMLLAYATLLVRGGRFREAQELLLKTEKAPGITKDQKTQLFMDYAVCAYRLGDIDKGIRLLEKQHVHHPCGLIYETLGYLYVEKYDASRRPAETDPVPAETAENLSEKICVSDGTVPEAVPDDNAYAEAPSEGVQPASDTADPSASETEPVPAPDPWKAGIEKALAFENEAVAYDDEDSIVLDNIGQFYYRVLEDRAKAREYFDKAIALKPGQIDTLWFLSRYDLEEQNAPAAVEKLNKVLEGRFSPLNYVTQETVEAELQRLQA